MWAAYTPLVLFDAAVQLWLFGDRIKWTFLSMCIALAAID